MMTDHVGQQLGNYRLLRLIGTGAFSEVYLGEHIFLKTQAAVKVLKMRLEHVDLENFLTEARTGVSLEHPNIVHVLECGVEGGTLPYLVMSYAAGGTLRRRYPKGTRLPFATILLYVKQVASALQYVHERGLIHRDVKPENMLLRRNDEVMLSDFGIAAVAHRTITQNTQEVAGTALYMAPEQLSGKPRPASDQYALGVVVYEWLCGEGPFHGSLHELYSQHLFTSPPPLQTKVPSILPAVEQVVLRALAKEPHQRFARVQDFADALEQASLSQQLPWRIPQHDPQFGSPPPQESPVIVRALPSSEPPPLPPILIPASYAGDTEQSISPYTSGGELTSRNGHRDISRSTLALLIGLVLLVVLGSAGIFSYPVLRSIIALPRLTATIHPTVTAPANSNAVMFGFDLQHTHFNPSENILSPANVSRLVPYWMVSTGDHIESSPAVVNGVVYVGSNDGKLYALDAKTGSTLWTYTTGNHIYSSPAVANRVAYVGSDDNKMYAFDARTGRVLWIYTTENAVGSSPVVANGVVYVGSNDGKMYAFDAGTGAIRWTSPPGSPIGSSPAVADGVVYVGSNDGKMYAFDARTGAAKWAFPTGSRIGSSPAVADGVVYVGSYDHTLYALDARTGVARWSYITRDRIDSSPAVARGFVYVGSFDGSLYALDARTGAVRWATHTRNSISSSPMVANGVVYVGSDDNKLYAFDAVTGRLLWTYTTGDHVSSSPAVVNGVVYVGSWDSQLYAFHLPPSTS